MSGGRVVLNENGEQLTYGGYHDREHLIPCEKICRVFELPNLIFRLPLKKYVDSSMDCFVNVSYRYKERLLENSVYCYKHYMNWKKWGLARLNNITVQDILAHPEEFGKYRQYIDDLEHYKATLKRMVKEYEMGYMSYYVC